MNELIYVKLLKLCSVNLNASWFLSDFFVFLVTCFSFAVYLLFHFHGRALSLWVSVPFLNLSFLSPHATPTPTPGPHYRCSQSSVFHCLTN